MRFLRVVVRFPAGDREALDGLRARYLAETQRGLSRASVVRVLVRRAMTGSENRSAVDVLGELDRDLVPRAAPVRQAQ